MSTSLAIPQVTDAAFAAETSTGIVAVEFSAAWCAPCRVFAPVLDAAAQAYASRMRFVQMDADANPATMARLGVRGLPTTLLFRDGQLVDRIVGAVNRATLFERLDRVVGPAKGG